ncbi:hybrid sensor histidine kinase/response regulator transcription factor [Alkalitalea saponilacus]|uniref:histidine kinase n=1 Tax=Alkalitalea saponilacus TaxID=889453 RepID=A0A1T5A8T0_9BACT|nr:hybrid sensor histidine kinase/response regulator transcription factor [Alkalitalea saponilacus]ASB48792.1 hybrid sensor histidine kinase/response regulator [Alkalitalea saponilacus]SKB31422.1 Two component regulator propeller [Alkalitalea saponilacus]
MKYKVVEKANRLFALMGDKLRVDIIDLSFFRIRNHYLSGLTKVRRFIITLLLGLTLSNGYTSNVIFHNINDIHGISLRETSSTVMDNYGFVWVASKMGILRLSNDDYHFYTLPYETSDVVLVRLIYHDLTLYAYTNNGQIFRYNPVLDQFDFYVNLAVLMDFRFLSISNLVIDVDGNFWFASVDGLVKYENGEISLFDKFTDVQFIEWIDDTTLAVSAQNQFVLFDIKNEDVVYELPESLTTLTRISDLYYDKEKSVLLIGTVFSGLYAYDFINSRSFRIESIPRQPILAIEQVTDSTYLIGVDGQGAWEIRRDTYHVTNLFKEDLNNQHSLRGNGVYDIYRDRNGRVWISTYSGGVSYFDYSPRYLKRVEYIINEPNSIVSNDINDMVEDRRGNLWFATNSGLSRWNRSTNEWASFYHNEEQEVQVFLSINEDVNGNIWAGTYSAGVFVLDGTTGEELARYSSETENIDFNNNFIFDIYRDKKDQLWIVGVRGDIIRYNSSTGEFRSYMAQPVYLIQQYSENTMLLGCSYGLSTLNTETGELHIVLSGYLVHDFYISGSNVWLCTVGDGLLKYNLVSGEKERFDESSGLPSRFINSIIRDGDYFWLGTETGLCKFNINNHTVENFSEIESFSGLSYNRTARLRLNSGELVFGTNRGSVIFDPEHIEPIIPNGKIFLQELRVMGKSLRPELTVPINSLNEIELRHNQGTLSLDILPLNMTSGSKFSWILEGLDSDWSLPIGSRTLNYSNLPTGKFTLRIRMYDNSMLKVVDERTLKIIKHPPFWETWWFLLAVSLFLLGVFYFSLKYHINLIKQLHSEEKIRFFANTAHDMRTSLTLIKAPIDELSTETGLSQIGKYYLELASAQVLRLTTVVTQLMDFQKADVGKEQLSVRKVDVVKLISNRLLMFDSLASEKNIDIRFKENSAFQEAYIDEVLIEKIVDNLISNAIKYSHTGGVVDVKFYTKGENWLLEIQDYGIGIDKSAQKQLFKEFYRGENAINSRVVGSGIGLILVKKYVELHGGIIECISQLDEGTTFKISIPANETAFNQVEILTIPKPSEEIFQPDDFLEDGFENLDSPTVLVVEDNDELREFLLLSLQSDFKVLMASNGKEAWGMISDNLPDLVISDVMMPEMNGFELCKLIKSTYETSHIPVVLLTALSDQAKQLEGLRLGADDYLMKPFNTKLLKQRIKSIIINRSAIHDKALKLIKSVDNEPILTNELNDQFVKKALKIVEENISNPLFNKDMFASEMNVSGSLLYKKIKSLTDKSPSDFIKSVRLSRALELLQSRKLTITEVSEMCGFSSIAYFSTVFKKHFGKPPSEILEM